MNQCPHCGVTLPAVQDAYCPDCRGDLSESPNDTAVESQPTQPQGLVTAKVSKYPVCPICPSCQSDAFRYVRPDRWVAFKNDRVCRSCGTRYTPPTPVWAGMVMIAFGAILSLGPLAGMWWSIGSGDIVAVIIELPLVLLGMAFVNQGVRAVTDPGQV